MAQREIKFRGFNNFAKAMYPAEHFALRSDGIWLQSMGDNEWLPSQGDMTFMQWTGLTDRNGVEIYEGDIVEVQTPDMAGEPFDELYEVKWDEWSASFNVEADDDTEHGLTAQARVIGNIYENPELLKEL